MKIAFQIIFLLFFILTQAQKPVDINIKKDTITSYEYKPRWYLNNVRDPTKVKKDIEKAIENLKKEQELEKKQLKQKPVVSPYSILALAYRKKPLRNEVVFSLILFQVFEKIQIFKILLD